MDTGSKLYRLVVYILSAVHTRINVREDITGFALSFPCSTGNTDLSLLAQGRGLMNGGVELECFGEDRRSFTLNVCTLSHTHTPGVGRMRINSVA